ncbi:MAG: AtpZ/AtpI family protein [Candidatus Aminicenantes bacterium]|nr:AtpZ/AtpI family protein [Candidatus Aminicenantes bacterium]
MSLFLGQGRSFDFKKFGEISSLALVLPSSIAVGLAIGYFLDKWLHTQPWMLLVWTILGVVSGVLNLWRGIKRYLSETENEEKTYNKPKR